MGGQYGDGAAERFATWGEGTEFHASDPVSIIGELFGRDLGSPGFQVGSRAEVSEALLFDIVYGRNVYDAPGDLYTVSLTVTF